MTAREREFYTENRLINTHYSPVSVQWNQKWKSLLYFIHQRWLEFLAASHTLHLRCWNKINTPDNTLWTGIQPGGANRAKKHATSASAATLSRYTEEEKPWNTSTKPPQPNDDIAASSVIARAEPSASMYVR